MVSRSFKNDLRLRPLRYRTPSPPRYAYEYGSPAVPNYSPITPKFKDESVELPAEPPSLNHAQKRSYDTMRRASTNVMEEFASIALATTVGQAFRQTDPFCSPVFNQVGEYTERPHKRSRSEKLPSPQHSRKSSRPFTSYTQPAADADRERDAALLLNFFQEARSNVQASFAGWHQEKFCRSPTAESVTLISTAEPPASIESAQVNEPQHPEHGSEVHIVHHPALGDIIENGVIYEHQPQAPSSYESLDQHAGNGLDSLPKTLETSTTEISNLDSAEAPNPGLENILPATIPKSPPMAHMSVDPITASIENNCEQSILEVETAVEIAVVKVLEPLAQPDHSVAFGTAEADVSGELEIAATETPAIEGKTIESALPPSAMDQPVAESTAIELDLRSDQHLDIQAQETSSIELAKDHTPSVSSTKSRPSVLPSVCASCNFARNILTMDTENNATSWICCDACKDWYHFACAGFKSEREVRGVDKYRCKNCKPKHGATTYVRKSARAHAAIDYAGLNEGVVKTSDENPEHHYIKPIKEGVIKFNPENFARMHPSLVTLEYFEKGDGMKEPIVIPASMNPRPQVIGRFQDGENTNDSSTAEVEQNAATLDKWLAEGLECETVPDLGQDAMDMIMPQNLTVRQVSELYGPEEKLDVIDVKSQEGEDKRWNLKKWADYYESTGSSKKVRNVISLEVSHSKLGRLIRRPKVVRDLDLQDSVWPQALKEKGEFPKVQFYCLMSVADCFTDFHIDFGGSSVFYHILKGKKTFFFIPPHEKHLKSYEEWCKSPAQNWTFLGDQTKECYRVDLSEGDTMLIPSGWIHAVWTPEDSLVIGGNFLTRMQFDMQIRVAQIEKATNVILKFRYPFFQKIMWFTALKYLEDDPLPESVMEELVHGGKFIRDVETYNEFDIGESSESSEERSHARYYSKAELEGLPGLARYLQRTALIASGTITDGVSEKTRAAIKRSIPKGYGEPLDFVKKFTVWAYWKRGNEPIPHWAYPDYVPEAGAPEVAEKKLSAKTLRRLDREAALQAFRIAPSRQSARMKSQRQSADTESLAEKGATQRRRRGTGMDGAGPSFQVEDSITVDGSGGDTIFKSLSMVLTSQAEDPDAPAGAPKKKRKSTGLPPKRRKLACESCRKRRRACKHGEATAIASYQPLDSGNVPDLGAGSSTEVTNLEILDDSQVQDPQLHSQPPTNGLPDPKNGASMSVETSAKMLCVEIVRTSSNLAPNTTTNGHTKSTIHETATISQSLDSNETTKPLSDLGENQVRTPGRSKACLDCRKSKRRCIHDENGNEDPVKANEAIIPRPSASKKRKVEGDNLPRTPSKKHKKSASSPEGFISQGFASSQPSSETTIRSTTVQSAPLAFTLGNERYCSPPTTASHTYAFSEASPEPVHLITVKPDPEPEQRHLHHEASSLVSPPASNHTDNERYTPTSNHTDVERDSPFVQDPTTTTDTPPRPSTFPSQSAPPPNPNPFHLHRASSRPPKAAERYTPESAHPTTADTRRASSSAATTCHAGRRASQSSLSSLDSEALTLRTSASPAPKEGTPGVVGAEGTRRKREGSSASGLAGVRKKARGSGSFGAAAAEDEESYRLIREMQAQELGLRRRK